MGLRVLARQLKQQSATTYHRWLLRRKLEILDKTLIAGRLPSPQLLERLHYAWGNEAWSADTSLLDRIVQWFPRTRGSVVECGSGLSTLLLASLARTGNRQIRSLEHDSQWAARVKDALNPDLSSYASIIDAPIRSYSDFDWYSEDVLSPIRQVGFVVCDGPPGSTRGGRYGLLPVLRHRMSDDAVVLVDDSQRPQERAIISRWCREYPAEIVEEGPTHCVLQLRGQTGGVPSNPT